MSWFLPDLEVNASFQQTIINCSSPDHGAWQTGKCGAVAGHTMWSCDPRAAEWGFQTCWWAAFGESIMSLTGKDDLQFFKIICTAAATSSWEQWSFFMCCLVTGQVKIKCNFCSLVAEFNVCMVHKWMKDRICGHEDFMFLLEHVLFYVSNVSGNLGMKVTTFPVPVDFGV